MAEIVNLRMARKAKARAEAEQKAAENRAKHGRGKAEKQRDKAEADRAARTIEGARRDGADQGEPRAARAPAPQKPLGLE